MSGLVVPNPSSIPSGTIVQWDFRFRTSSVAGPFRILDCLAGQIVINASGKLAFSNTTGTLTSTTALVANTWYAVRINVQSTGGRMFINGVLEASGATPNNAWSGGGGNGYITLGNSSAGSAVLWFDEFRYLYGLVDDNGTSSYPVDTTAFAGPPSPEFTALAVPAYELTSVAAPLVTATQMAAKAPRLFNVYRPWRGVVAGTVKQKDTPANTPVARLVVLIDERDQTVVDKTWSDSATGAYAFRELDPGGKYTALSYDYTGSYRAVLGSGLSPQVSV
ncbi:LamG-like jellyroll fold domain-containing protein [Niveibacterium sp. SC-1]|uniref:LamG-like jellyroll fold domain-containing protein n=1 Tax=Niveibacterium sp. SC-1 TaxID=3135646 RepID=UPI00311FAF31